jgi:hypothetical protein
MNARRTAALLLLLALSSLGCQGSSPSERAKTAASWLATTRAVVQEWSSNSTPQSYAEKNLESTTDMIRRERESAQKQTNKGGEEAKTAADLVRSLDQALVLLGRLQEAVRVGDRPKALSSGAELVGLESALRKI